MSYKAFILNAACDPTFRLRAFSDYCEKRQQLAQEYVQILNEAIESVEVTDTDAKITKGPDEILSTHPNFRGANNVLLANGYQTLREIVGGVLLLTYGQIVGDGDMYDSTHGMPLYAANHQSTGSASLSDILQDAVSSLHSITALCAANAAALTDDVASKLTVFRDRMQRYFQSGYSDVSNMASYYLSLVEQTKSQEEYLQQVDAGLNLTGLAADESADIPANSPVYDITGASPVGPLNWTTVSDSVSSAVNVGLKVVKGIWNGVKSGVQKIFSKAKKHVREVVVDPFDIALDFPDNELNTVDGYCYQMVTQEGQGWLVNPRVICPSLGLADVQKLQGDLFKTALISGELLVKPTSIGGSDTAFAITGQMAFKPRPISEDTYNRFFSWLNAYMLNADDPTEILMSQSTVDAIVDALNAITKDPDMYVTVQNTERDLLKGYIYGYLLTLFLLQADYHEQISLATDPSWTGKIYYIPSTTVNSFVPSSVTNLSFVQTVAGWNGTDFGSDFFSATTSAASAYPKVFVEDAISTIGGLHGIFRYMYTWFCGILNSMSQEISNPLDFPFIPYRKNKESFSTSQLAIKTDSRNFDAFNKFAIKVIVTAIAAAIAVTGIVVSKKILRSVTNKRLIAKSQIEAKLWKDPPDNAVSKGELRRYARYSRKLDASKLLNADLQSGSGSVITSLLGSSSDSLLNDIITVLKG